MFLYHNQIRGLNTVILLVLLLGIGCCLWKNCGSEDSHLALSQADADSLRILEKQLQEEAVREEWSDKNRLNPQAHPFPFDPNHADSATLRKVGLSERHVHNMMTYRRKGGRWHSPEDFSRLYNLEREDFERLRPYIRIAPEDRAKNYSHEEYYGTPKGEVPQYEHIDKYEEGTKIDLNSADTTALKRIPGIGSYYARKIIAYRERLGGFVWASQVDEVEGLPPGTSRWFETPHTQPLRLRINHSTFKELVRHPYLSYEQTKDIVNHIRRYGPIRSWQDLKLYKEFTDEDFRRLTPYVSFD